MISIFAVLLLLATPTPADTQNRGKLCIASAPECQDTAGESVTIAADESERMYV